MAVSSPLKLVGWVLGVLDLCSLATSFAHHHCITPASASSCVPTATPCRRDRGTALRLAPGKEQRGEDETTASTADISEFEQTSGPVKAVVSGLTDLFVLLSGGENKEEIAPAAPKASVSVEQLEAGIRQEYVKNYLWTGDINEALYEEDCSFTDPTLSFSGLSTYRRNVGSLQGVLDRLVSNSRSVLYSCELRQDQSCVQTRWRMVGDLRLPWDIPQNKNLSGPRGVLGCGACGLCSSSGCGRVHCGAGPTIDVVGRTTFSYDTSRGNRIFSYDEVWEVEPVEALLQIFKPRKRDNDPLLPDE